MSQTVQRQERRERRAAFPLLNLDMALLDLPYSAGLKLSTGYMT